MGTALLISVTFTHLAPKEIYGQYNLIMSFLSLFALFSMPGLNNSVLRSTARGYDGSYKKAVKMSFMWSLVGIPVIFITGVYYYFYINQISGICLMIACIFFPFLNAPNTWDSFLQGKKRFDLTAKYAIAIHIMNAIFTITILFLTPNNVISIFITYGTVNVVLVCFCYFRSFKYIENDLEDDECLHYGYFLTASNVLGTIANNIDNIIVGMLLGPIDLATYAIATRVPLLVKDFTKFFWAPFTPEICKDEVTLSNVFDYIGRKFIMGFLVLVFVGSVIYWFFVGDVIIFLFGSNYADSAYFAQILLLMVLISIPTIFLSTFCIVKKDRKAIVVNSYIFPFVKVFIMGLSIYYYGLLGAIWGLNISWLIQLTVTWLSMGEKK